TALPSKAAQTPLRSAARAYGRRPTDTVATTMCCRPSMRLSVPSAVLATPTASPLAAPPQGSLPPAPGKTPPPAPSTNPPPHPPPPGPRPVPLRPRRRPRWGLGPPEPDTAARTRLCPTLLREILGLPSSAPQTPPPPPAMAPAVAPTETTASSRPVDAANR